MVEVLDTGGLATGFEREIEIQARNPSPIKQRAP